MWQSVALVQCKSRRKCTSFELINLTNRSTALVSSQICSGWHVAFVWVLKSRAALGDCASDATSDRVSKARGILGYPISATPNSRTPTMNIISSFSSSSGVSKRMAPSSQHQHWYRNAHCKIVVRGPVYVPKLHIAKSLVCDVQMWGAPVRQWVTNS
ncbi:hypothetical protein HaLaN_02614 [Haematococcus lacustris]|uniref:Uncharacterized protein n=1 Tax=Haematococcus lacustris TaxID=44745 RepID=A0A699YEJ1_HAELA|nr:hypothetical protein HaLaN_02614 [Haematococcus lacustris]